MLSRDEKLALLNALVEWDGTAERHITAEKVERNETFYFTDVDDEHLVPFMELTCDPSRKGSVTVKVLRVTTYDTGEKKFHLAVTIV